MINLEELNLNLSVGRYNSSFIDGIQLHEQVLIHLRQLNKFTFNISTRVRNDDATVYLQSNEDIQRSFIGKSYPQVVSYTEINSTKMEGNCHIHSLPFDFDCIFNLDNSFQGGTFHKVRYLKMNDTLPFEYKFLKRISQDFTFVRFLYIGSCPPPKDKNNSLELITFPYLTLLDLEYVHNDYVELFLLRKTAHLPSLLHLTVKYKSLTIITNHFRKDPMYFNFQTVKTLRALEPFVRSENFHQYFPLLFN